MPEFVTILLAAACLATAAKGAPVPKPVTEDRDVAEYFKAQGWELAPTRWGSRSPIMMTLSVTAPQPEFGFNSDKAKITDEGYKMLGRARAVEFLNLMHVDCTDAGLEAIGANQSLAGINVICYDITDEGIKALAGAKGLTHIHLKMLYSKIGDAGVGELGKLPKLESLELHHSSLTGSCFEALAECKTLKRLHVSTPFGETGLTDETIKPIAKLPGLTDLQISGEGRLTSACIRAIVETRLPDRFKFNKAHLDDALLASLLAEGHSAPTTDPRRDEKPKRPDGGRYIPLATSGFDYGNSVVLLNCPNAESLDLGAVEIHDATYLKLKDITKLKSASLWKTQVTAVVLAALAEAPIECLTLDDGRLSETMLELIGKMTKLVELRIPKSRFEAAWFRHLAGLPALRSLNFENTALTDEGFEQLLKLPKLNEIRLTGSKVTKEAIANAIKNHPGITIHSAFPAR